MWDKSVKFSKETVDEALKKVSTFRSDMGGTEIYQGLDKCYKLSYIKGYPTNFFLLTDGGVSSPD